MCPQNKQSNGKAAGKKRKSTTKAGSKSPKKAVKRGKPSAASDEDDDGNESKEYEVRGLLFLALIHLTFVFN